MKQFFTVLVLMLVSSVATFLCVARPAVAGTVITNGQVIVDGVVQPPPVLYQDEGEAALAKKCQEQGFKWVQGQPSHCVTTSLQEEMNKCPQTDRQHWIWNGLIYEFECAHYKATISEYFDGLKAQCLKAGNQWNNYRYCVTAELKKSQDQCDADSGRFFWDGLAHKFTCYVSPYDQKKLDECKAKGGEYGTFGGTRNGGSNRKYCRVPEEQARKDKCLADGGKWGPHGMAGIPGCTSTFSDADKACHTNTDCMSKKCLVDKTTKEHGKCFGTNEPFGCFDYFEKSANGSRMMECVD